MLKGNKGTVVILVSQDNVFVNVVASVQYRAVRENAKDAFYMLTNPKEQIQSYVFDGKLVVHLITVFFILHHAANR